MPTTRRPAAIWSRRGGCSPARRSVAVTIDNRTPPTPLSASAAALAASHKPKEGSTDSRRARAGCCCSIVAIVSRARSRRSFSRRVWCSLCGWRQLVAVCNRPRSAAPRSPPTWGGRPLPARCASRVRAGRRCVEPPWRRRRSRRRGMGLRGRSPRQSPRRCPPAGSRRSPCAGRRRSVRAGG